MQKIFFHHFSDDLKTLKEDIPDSPFWHIQDIFERSHSVLRRRISLEVRERALLIQEALTAFTSRLNDLVSELPAEEAKEARKFLLPYDDDAFKLTSGMTLEHTVPLCRTIEDNFKDVPWAAEEGWILAESLAVLALMKIDSAINYLQSDDSVKAAVCLLDAYRCCALAVDEDGMLVQTEDERIETMESRNKNKKALISWQNSSAKDYRESELLKSAVFDKYKYLRKEQPKAKIREIAKQINKLFIDHSPEFKDFSKCLTGDSLKTFDDWVRKFDRGQIPTQKPSPSPDNAEDLLALKTLLKKKNRKFPFKDNFSEDFQ